MGAGLQRVSDRLKVETVLLEISGKATMVCVINVLSSEVLTDSLRDIGARTLPLHQPA